MALGIQQSWGGCADTTQTVAPNRSKFFFSHQRCNKMKCSEMLFEGLRFVGKGYIVAVVRGVRILGRRRRRAVSGALLPDSLLDELWFVF